MAGGAGVSKVLIESAGPKTDRTLGAETQNLRDQLRRRLSALVAKAERKGRTKAEVDEIVRWLTGFSDEAFAAQLEGVGLRDLPCRGAEGKATEKILRG